MGKLGWAIVAFAAGFGAAWCAIMYGGLGVQKGSLNAGS